ncbi:Alkylated DNA repair protein alkB homolog 8 (Probable alpha-ketoglutarate-dependent dioxygenase ABH8) (S-adenosyl-L-methionine-dependent tRNA methyltransferase ABH8) (tRNA (carboxymethyluridine(34)-5-O)-methyltransferase ABH8), partial [Durusdinium trenchii]
MVTVEAERSAESPLDLHAEGFTHLRNFLLDEEVRLLEASVAAGPRGETLSSGRPPAASPGVHWHGFPRAHCWLPETQDQQASLPEICLPALDRLRDLGILPPGYAFDQAIVNFYAEGSEGIRMHVDRANFDDIIVGFSLGASAVMDLEPLDTRGEDSFASRCQHVLLEEGSVYVFSGNVRWKWKHGI